MLRDAATIAVLRGDQTPEVFLLRRHGKASFMANVWVYPGGQLDPADALPTNAEAVAVDPTDAQLTSLDPDPAIARGLCLAAIRETFEEAGILVGASAEKLGERIHDLRKALHARQMSLVELAHTFELTFDLRDVVYFAHWITPVIEPKRFDTRFFLATAPADQTGEHDHHETTDSRWIRPADALDLARTGAMTLAPPTIRTLEQLAAFDTSAAAMAWARTQSAPCLVPHFEEVDGEMTLLLPGDPLYPLAVYPEAEPVGDTVTRMTMRHGFWESGTA